MAKLAKCMSTFAATMETKDNNSALIWLICQQISASTCKGHSKRA